MTDTENQPRTFIIDVWQDESIWTWEGVATSSDDAEAAATLELNSDWDQEYATFADLAADMNGTATRWLPAVMADRIPLATLELYRRLADGLSDMVSGGRLTAADVPDDHAWLVEQLASIAAAADPCPCDVVTPAGPPASPLWSLFAARDGETLRLTIEAADEEAAETKAMGEIVKRFGLEFLNATEFYEVQGECDGVRLEAL